MILSHPKMLRLASSPLSNFTRNHLPVTVSHVAFIAEQDHAVAQCRSKIVQQVRLPRQVLLELEEKTTHVSGFS